MEEEGEEREEEKEEEKLEVDVVLNLHKSHHHHHYCWCSELDSLQYSLWMSCLQLPPIFAVYVLSLCVQITFDIPLFPHPAGAAVEPAAHSAN